MPAMAAKYPDNNEYWSDKRAKMEKIKVPSYIFASYSTSLHYLGSFRGFEEIESKHKWYKRVLPTPPAPFVTNSYVGYLFTRPKSGTTSIPRRAQMTFRNLWIDI